MKEQTGDDDGEELKNDEKEQKAGDEEQNGEGNNKKEITEDEKGKKYFQDACQSCEVITDYL